MSANSSSTGRRGTVTRRARIAALAAGTALTLVLAAVHGLPHAQAQAAGSSSELAAMPSLSPLVKKVMPAVVNISVVEKSSDDGDAGGPEMGPGPFPNFPPGSPFDEFLRRFFQNQKSEDDGTPAPHRQQMALGSGFIIDPAGYVVTNNHVVDGSEKVTVVFQDGSRHPATIVGRDAKTDLALLKISVDHPLPYVAFGTSSDEQVGDWVVAVGNPFGLGGTVSAGIVSARGRDIHSGPYDNFLQIDAPINRGNSGGPTFNLKGEVIGINTAIYSPNGGSVGIGFAIPSDLAKPVIDQLREHGKVSRGWLGVQIQEVTPAIAKSMGLPNDHGALVADVTKGSPAEKAGVKQGDVIESFNGHQIEKLRDLPIMVAETPAGSEAKVQVRRGDEDKSLDVAIAEQPANLGQLAEAEGGHADRAEGLALAPLTSAERERFHVPERVKGVLVRSISDSSPFNEVDLRPGDVIVAINQQPVTSPEEAAGKLSEAMNGPDKRVLLLLNRHGSSEYVALSQAPNQG